MVITFALAAATIATPPIAAAVNAAPTIPHALVQAALDEAATVWRTATVSLVWQLEPHVLWTAVADGRRLNGPSLRVSFDDGETTVKDYAGTIGWIVFDGPNTPRPEIH